MFRTPGRTRCTPWKKIQCNRKVMILILTRYGRTGEPRIKSNKLGFDHNKHQSSSSLGLFREVLSQNNWWRWIVDSMTSFNITTILRTPFCHPILPTNSSYSLNPHTDWTANPNFHLSLSTTKKGTGQHSPLGIGLFASSQAECLDSHALSRAIGLS
mgnify:CR=1 FL=1